MNRRCLSALAALAAVLWAAAAGAHGLYATAEPDAAAVVVRFAYSSGEAMSYAEVKVFAPGGGDLEHQNGRTDARGRFAFVPDRDGDWSVRASDGMGHRTETTVTVGGAGSVAPAPPAAGGGDLRAVFLGLSLIANICLLAALVHRRRSG